MTDMDDEVGYYHIPKSWPGHTCVIVGTGPSLNQQQVDYCKDKAKVIVINNAYELAPWADHLHACDVKWWRWHHEDACKFEGVKTCLEDPAAEYPGVNLLNNTGLDGYDERPWCCRTGSNGGYQGVHIAMHYGCKKILLIGFDHRIVNDKSHYFGDHRDGIRSNYDNWHWRWVKLKNEADRRGVEIINCTPSSGLRVFPFGNIEEML